jgi:sodium/bile acid cotransporter 7
MKNGLRQHWFLAALVSTLVAGFVMGDTWEAYADAFPRRALVAFVLFLMAWSLDSAAILRAVRKPQAAALGIAVNFAVVPVLAWAAGRFLVAPLDDGLALVGAVPCTLAAAAVWTRRAAGNDAVALVVTMVTNFSCFIVTPLLLWLMTGATSRDGFDPKQMVGNLFVIAVLPMAAGQLLRLSRRMARWATSQKVALSTVAQLGILTMVLIGSVKSAAAINSATSATVVSLKDLLAMIVAVTFVHVAALYFGFSLGRFVGLGRAEWIAVGVAGSQKTLMIGLHLALAQNLGIGMLPMVAYHAVQLTFDTLIADRMVPRQDA